MTLPPPRPRGSASGTLPAGDSRTTTPGRRSNCPARSRRHGAGLRRQPRARAAVDAHRVDVPLARMRFRRLDVERPAVRRQSTGIDLELSGRQLLARRRGGVASRCRGASSRRVRPGTTALIVGQPPWPPLANPGFILDVIEHLRLAGGRIDPARTSVRCCRRLARTTRRSVRRPSGSASPNAHRASAPDRASPPAAARRRNGGFGIAIGSLTPSRPGPHRFTRSRD